MFARLLVISPPHVSFKALLAEGETAKIKYNLSEISEPAYASGAYICAATSQKHDFA